MPSTTTIDYECDNCSKRVRSDGRDGQKPEGWTRGGVGPYLIAISYSGSPPDDWYCDECNAAAAKARQQALDDRSGLYA